MTEGKKRPSWAIKALIILALVVAVGAVMAAKTRSRADKHNDGQNLSVATGRQGSLSQESAVGEAKVLGEAGSLPKMVDLGAKSCVPCKMMAPILEELKRDFSHQFETVFIDVWENPSAGNTYGIRVIPTQIFFDANGNEVFRHEGFYSKEDILAKWKELGVDLHAYDGQVTATINTTAPS